MSPSATLTTSSPPDAPLAAPPPPPGARLPDDAATAYARSVVEGRVLACKWVRLACERHLRDLEHGHERGLWWDAEEVEDVRLYFLGLRHSKGRWAKPTPQRIVLEPWQLFVLGSIFGWKRANGRRRIRTAYCEVPRKNTKSTTAAGVGLRLAFDDEEPGARVYSAATKRDQARVVWDEAKLMVLKSASLRRRIVVMKSNMNDPKTASAFEPLGKDARTIDGLNVHGAVIDELHAHKTREMWDVLESAVGARDQSLLFAITTAGFQLESVCYEEHMRVQKILEGVIEEDSVFGIIYTIDEGDDWRDPACWPKANPMLGVTIQRDELQMQCQHAIQTPSARTSFLTKRLNVWVNAGVAEVDMLLWARAEAAFTIEELREASCWVGVDLASKSDLAAVLAVFVRDGEVWIKPRFYLPKARVDDAAHAATAHYAGWAAAGWLTLTEDDLIDFDVIRADLMTIAHDVSLQEIDFDPYKAANIETDLKKLGLGEDQVVEIPQTVRHLSGPMYAVRDLLRAGKLHHDGNPVMTWCASNVVSREDVNGNLFPRKQSRALKIDGYTAMLNALSRCLLKLDAAMPKVTAL